MSKFHRTYQTGFSAEAPTATVLELPVRNAVEITLLSIVQTDGTAETFTVDLYADDPSHADIVNKELHRVASQQTAGSAGVLFKLFDGEAFFHSKLNENAGYAKLYIELTSAGTGAKEYAISVGWLEHD